MNKKNISFQNSSNRYELMYLNIFWGGVILYTFGSILGSTSFLDIRICQVFQALGIFVVIPAAAILGKARFDSGYLRIMFTLYFVWLVGIILRGHFSLDYTSLKDFLFGTNNGGLIYLAPLVLLFPRKFYYYNRLFDVLTFTAILFFILCVVFIKKLLFHGDDTLSQAVVENLFDVGIPAAFIVLTYLYHSRKRNLIALASVALMLFFSVVRARRGLIFITSSLILFSILLYFFHTKKKLAIIYFAILFSCIAAISSTNLYRLQNNKLVGFLYQRGNEDTRSLVEILFYDDMKPKDWAIGRGIDGQYFAPDIEVNQVTNFRTVIETGYLQLILKGGIISLGLLLLITFPAAINGIFFSKNILSKASGIWILQFMINLYPQNSVSFNLSYLMVWVAVGICYSKEIRGLSNDSVKHLLNIY